MQSFQEKRPIKIKELVTLKRFVAVTGRPVPCTARLASRRTDRQTDRQTDRRTVTLAAHARRGLTSGANSGQSATTLLRRRLALFSLSSGPPANFVSESRTHGLSFSWELPPGPSTPTGYSLECHATVVGASNPSPVETTERSATLFPLSPGVLYFCTLNALIGSKVLPSATITATTVESGIDGYC